MQIEQLELSQRTYNCLKRSQITRVGQILERTPDELLQLRNFGQKSLQELQDKLRQHGLSLTGTELETDGLGLGEEAEDDDLEDQLATDLLSTGDLPEGEVSEEDDDLAFEAALDAGEFEADDEEPLTPRGAASRAGRERRDDDWGEGR
jgi:hypothetical protein